MPPSSLPATNFLGLNEPLQYAETSVDYHSSETITGHLPLAPATHVPSYHPCPLANENIAGSTVPIVQIKNVCSVLATFLEQEPVNATTGVVHLLGHPYQNSIESSLSDYSGRLYAVATSDPSLSHAASNYIAGPSNTSTSESGGSSL